MPPEKINRLASHVNKFAWPEHLLDLLGKIPDKEMAEMAGIHHGTVTNERRRRGIKSLSPHREIKWTAEMIKVLGTASDREVAAILGINHRSVFTKRTFLKIPPFGPLKFCHNPFWTPENEALLGTASDRDIAKRLGIVATRVHFRRRKLGIPPFSAPVGRLEWSKEMISLLGKITDRKFVELYPMTLDSVHLKRKELGIEPCVDAIKTVVRDDDLRTILQLPNKAVMQITGLTKGGIQHIRREVGMPAPSGRRFRWKPEFLEMLGKVSDSLVAKEIGLVPNAVGFIRRAMGIKPCHPRKPWTKKEIALLGTADDKQIAKRVKRSCDTVRAKRLSLKIPLFSSSHAVKKKLNPPNPTKKPQKRS